MYLTLATLWLAIGSFISGGTGIAGISYVLDHVEWKEPSEEEIIYVAKTIYGEANECDETQKSAVAWCICNRVDSVSYPDNVIDVTIQPYQFHGYNPNNKYLEEDYKIAYNVLFDWMNGINLRRTLPQRFLYFHADRSKGVNVFTTDHLAGEIHDFAKNNKKYKEAGK